MKFDTKTGETWPICNNDRLNNMEGHKTKIITKANWRSSRSTKRDVGVGIVTITKRPPSQTPATIINRIRRHSIGLGKRKSHRHRKRTRSWSWRPFKRRKWVPSGGAIPRRRPHWPSGSVGFLWLHQHLKARTIRILLVKCSRLTVQLDIQRYHIRSEPVGRWNTTSSRRNVIKDVQPDDGRVKSRADLHRLVNAGAALEEETADVDVSVLGGHGQRRTAILHAKHWNKQKYPALNDRQHIRYPPSLNRFSFILNFLAHRLVLDLRLRWWLSASDLSVFLKDWL